MLKRFFELLKKGDIKGIMLEPTEDTFLQFFRYIFVGGASFVADYVLLHLITEMGVYYLVSGVISFIAGLCVNYALSKLLVFSKKTEGAEKAKEFTVFAVIAVFGLIITEGLMWLFTEKLGWYYMISKAVAAVIVLFWNFFMKKILLYRKK
ncbi:MAG: GtrA family protein [Oscillospiraceae bacterium]|nr:GtrA family protein [Oscillospiraceae bacterium]